MLRKEKVMEQPIYLKKTFAAETETLRVEFKKAFRFHLFQRSIEPALYVHSELFAEIRILHMAEFHLQYKFSNHALVLIRREGSPDRKRALLHLIDIGIPVMLILIMSAVDVRERGHSEPDHIRTGPQQVSVEESSFGVLHGRVSAPHRVAGLLQLRKCITAPFALNRPIRNRRDCLPEHAHFLEDGRVVRHFHLI